MRQNLVKVEPHYLSGWKDIAAHLGKGVRIVQRYQRKFGLPVRRPAGKPCGSVVALVSELDAWVKSCMACDVVFLKSRALSHPALQPSISGSVGELLDCDNR
jgi:hypothetical protein